MRPGNKTIGGLKQIFEGFVLQTTKPLLSAGVSSSSGLSKALPNNSETSLCFSLSRPGSLTSSNSYRVWLDDLESEKTNTSTSKPLAALKKCWIERRVTSSGRTN